MNFQTSFDQKFYLVPYRFGLNEFRTENILYQSIR